MNLGQHGFFLPGTCGAGILLIHGLTGTPAEVRYVGKHLNRAGFSVLAPQLDGHCGTEADLLRTGWRDWAGSVQRGYEALRKEVDVVFAAGLSMGAVLALHLAAGAPGKVRGLALYSTTLRWDGWSIPRLGVLMPFILRLPFLKNYRFEEGFPYGIKDERLRNRVVTRMKSGDAAAAGLTGTPAPSILELRGLVAQVKRDMPRITTPALILHARNDDITSVWNAEYLEKNLAGPRNKVLLDDCYHMITVDKQRHEVVRHTADYFKALLGEQPACTPRPREKVFPPQQVQQQSRQQVQQQIRQENQIPGMAV